MPEDTSAPLMGAVKFRPGLGFRKVLNDSLSIFVKDALRVALKSPSQALFLVKAGAWQRRSARIRANWEKQGIHIPPIMIFSITNRCNLHCKGCYHRALHESGRAEMEAEKVKSVVAEAKELGFSIIAVAGGEPLVRPEIYEITAAYPEIIYLVFTNGTMIDDEALGKIASRKNFVPVLSLEGYQADTDARRGQGVYAGLKSVIGRLKSRDVFWAVSLTVTRNNFDTITDEGFVKELVEAGCKLFFFVEYTPVSEDTEDWVPTDEQRDRMLEMRDKMRARFPALFIAIPGDEEEIGGCLSAGRGFIHISAEGNVEPCPFAPYSDTSVRDMSLKDALQSEFLRTIRDNHDKLTETEGGCAIWTERAWVKSLVNK